MTMAIPHTMGPDTGIKTNMSKLGSGNETDKPDEVPVIVMDFSALVNRMEMDLRI